MKTEQELIDEFPVLFQDCGKTPMESCMSWGIECGSGWHSLIQHLCTQLQWNIDKNGYPPVKFAQIKEKFGTLRIYHDFIDDGKEYEDRKYFITEGMIDMVESISGITCEKCGGPVEKVGTRCGWYSTIYSCEKCKGDVK